MSYVKNLKVIEGNILRISGSSIEATGSLFASTISGNLGHFTSLSASSLRINDSYNLPTSDGENGQVVITDGQGSLSFTTIEAGSITPGGIDSSIQFKKGTAFSGSSDLKYDYNTGILSGTVAQLTTLTSSVISSSTLIAGGTTYPTQTGSLAQTLILGPNNTLEFNDLNVTIAVKNLEVDPIPKGTPLYVTSSGTQGNTAGVYRADAGNPSRMPAACVANADIPAGGDGLAILSGFINGVNTSTFLSGEAVYVAVGGGYTNVRPTGSALVQPLGYVEKVDSTNGSGVVQGPGHHYILPNVTPGYFWVGASNGVPTTVASSSFAKLSSNNTFTGTNNFQTITASHIDVDTITAREYYTELVSASVIYQSGSTKFGNTTDDEHQFTGSVNVSGSLNLENASFTINEIQGNAGEVNLFTGNNHQIKIGKDGLSTNTITLESREIILDAGLEVNFVTNTIDVDAVGTTFKLFESRTGNTELLNTCGNISIGSLTTAPTPIISLGKTSSGQVTVKNNLQVNNILTTTNGANIGGVLAANGASITTNDSTFSLLNTTATTINFGGATISMNIGAATGTTTVQNRLVVNGSTAGDSTIAGNLNVDSNTLYVDAINNEVGIGKNNPNAKLDVNGSAIVSGSLTVSGTVTELSTRRIKKNIRMMKSQLDTITKLNPVTYYRRDTKEKTKEYGFISEEVAEVYPEFVRNEGVNYSKMVSVLVSAVKELKEIVEEQREEIKTLKKKIK